MTLARKGSEIEQLSDPHSVWDATVAALTAEGIDHVIYLTVDRLGETPFLRTTCPEIYDGMPPQYDPFLHHCCTSYDFTRTGGAYMERYDYLSEEARAFIARASKLAFTTGFGIPMRLQGSSRYGGFNMGTGLSIADFEERFIGRVEEFRFFCLLVHRRLEELLTPAQTASTEFRSLLIAPNPERLTTLSPREKEVVYLIARGVSRKECARLCDISPHTVAEYAKGAYRKLGVTNRAEAAQLLMAAE